MSALLEGFLPLTRPDDLPARDRRVGLRELGLPYETEPAITRHLAAFLTRAATWTAPAWPVPTPSCSTAASSRRRWRAASVLDALESWFGGPAEGAREREPRGRGGARRGVLRQAAAGRHGRAAPADSRGERPRLLCRGGLRGQSQTRGVRDTEGHRRRDEVRAGTRVQRPQQPAGGVHALQLDRSRGYRWIRHRSRRRPGQCSVTLRS